MINKLLNLAIQIQQVPAPTNDETLRGKFITEKMQAESPFISQVHTDSAGNVLGCLPGSGQGAPLIISAHMDTVFPLDTELTIRNERGRVYGPGIGDNSLGVAGLFGILWRLRASGASMPGDIWFVANTGEEGLGDLRGMKALVGHFGSKPKAYLILEGMALGHVYHQAVGVQRYKISLHTDGGHSWTDYGKPSAIHELSRLVTNISAIRLTNKPHTTLNVGRISGGTSINTIAADSWMELDLRSEEQDSLAKLIAQVETLVADIRHANMDVEMTSIGQRPSGEISADHPLVQLAQNCLRKEGIEPVLTIGSTDANIPLSMGYPALVLGLSHGGGAHTLHEFIETAPIEKGLEHLIQFISQAWN